MGDIDRKNYGMILAGGAAEPDRTAPYTLIVSGLGRSGTSMIATILHSAGVLMGDPPLEVVIEDPEILAAASTGQEALLRQIIARRNAIHPVWGFKLPNMHAYLRAEQVGWFRNPRMILVFRDPVAIAVRDSLSEYFEPGQKLTSSLHGMVSAIAFAERARCPTLMLSYEKSIAAPERTVRAVLRYSGLRASDAMVKDLARVVQPDNPAYLRTANSQFVGFIDGIEEGHLTGWCQQVGALQPVTLDLIANDQVLTTFVATEFRQDLADLQIGNGNHGFRVDLRPFHLPADTVIRLRLSKRSIEVQGSGKTIGELQGFEQAIAARSFSPTPVPAADLALAMAPQPPLPASPPRESLGSW